VCVNDQNHDGYLIIYALTLKLGIPVMIQRNSDMTLDTSLIFTMVS